MANHISHLDPLYDSVAVRKSGRIPRFMAKASLWKVPVLGKALAGSDQIPVERTRRRRRPDKRWNWPPRRCARARWC